MGRTADKPGTYRIRQKLSGGWVLSGVRTDGQRVKVPVGSQFEGDKLAASLFPLGIAAGPVIPEITKPAPALKFDDWGLPVVTEESAQSVASAMGIPPTPPPQPTPTVAEQDAKVKEAAAKNAEIQANRKKYAKSLCELIGHGYAMGVVMGSKRAVTSLGKEPVKPSPKQVTDLAEVTKDTITEWFGDHEVKPWIMMILLTIGIPLSMYIQSPKKPSKQLTEQEQADAQSQGLRSVT
jgi:hypothetical protein